MRSASAPRIFATLPSSLVESAIPGYTGFIPGLAFEADVGISQTQARQNARETCINRSVAQRCQEQKYVELQQSANQARERGGEALADDDARFPKHMLTVAGTRRGARIPGYTGYIPGKSVGGVIGLTFANSNSASMHVPKDRMGGIGLQSQKTPSEARG